MLIDIFNLQLARRRDRWHAFGDIFYHEPFFMLHHFGLHNSQFLLPSQPYLLREGRVVLVRRGEASYSFNLVEHRFRAGDLVVFNADTLVEKQGHTDDFEFDAFNFPAPPTDDVEGPSYLCLPLTETLRPIVDMHFDLLWALVNNAEEFPQKNVSLLTESLLQVVRSHAQAAPPVAPTNRNDALLNRFLMLVSRYASRERNIPFYASRLCLASHYLSALIRQISGRTVMQWINQTCVKEIKVWLAYSDDSVGEIAHRLNFPCAASLTKFFKRQTGLTPSLFRHQAQQSLAR